MLIWGPSHERGGARSALRWAVRPSAVLSAVSPPSHSALFSSAYSAALLGFGFRFGFNASDS
ncbi:MAG: hypothetical protein ACKESB_02735 [Candidatus Hodgkinia cicadicola]